jgi:hypothetical protein
MPRFFFMPRSDVFDYLQLCCLVVMVRVWGGSSPFWGISFFKRKMPRHMAEA